MTQWRERNDLGCRLASHIACARLALFSRAGYNFGPLRVEGVGAGVRDRYWVVSMDRLLLFFGFRFSEWGRRGPGLRSVRAAVQSALAIEEQCRAPLRSRWPALFAVPRCRQTIQLRVFRNAGCDAGRRPASQEAASCRKAADRARPPRPRYRFGLGRAWSVSGRNDRRQCYRRHAVDRTVAGAPAPPRRPARRRNSAEVRTFPARSTASCRWACSSMSASIL